MKIQRSVAVLCLMYLFVGCGGDEGANQSQTKWDLDATGMNPSENAGDWLIIHELSDSDKLHPFVSTGASATYIEQLIFETLTIMDNHTLTHKPVLAKSLPEVSDDKLTYTFELRTDVHFSDGEPMTGEDVIFSLKALKNPFTDDAPIRNYYKNVTSVELVDGDLYKVRFTCDDVYFKHAEMVGELWVYPKHIYDPNGLLDDYSFAELSSLMGKFTGDEADFASEAAYQFAEFFNSTEVGRKPIASGPYLFKEWKTDDRVVLERNHNFWGDGAEGIEQKNYVERIVFKTIKDFSAALTGMKSGDVDIIRSMTPELFYNQTNSTKFMANNNKTVFYIPSYSYFGWNNNHPIFSDKMVRRAMTHLCDRQKIVDILLFGDGEIAKSSVYFKRPEYNDDIEPWSYDTQKARDILTAQGWGDSNGDGILDKMIGGKLMDFEFTFLTNNGNETRKKVGLIMVEELRKVGIKADLQQQEWAVYLDNVRDHKFDAIILGWVMPITDTDPYQIWHSSQATGRGSNSIAFSNARADELIEMNRREFDAAKRAEYMKEFQAILHEEQPYTFLYVPKTNFSYHKRFRGVEIYPFRPGYDPSEWWVPKEMWKYSY